MNAKRLDPPLKKDKPVEVSGLNRESIEEWRRWSVREKEEEKQEEKRRERRREWSREKRRLRSLRASKWRPKDALRKRNMDWVQLIIPEFGKKTTFSIVASVDRLKLSDYHTFPCVRLYDSKSDIGIINSAIWGDLIEFLIPQDYSKLEEPIRVEFRGARKADAEPGELIQERFEIPNRRKLLRPFQLSAFQEQQQVWLYRGKLVIVVGRLLDQLPDDEVSTRVKHLVLKDEKALERMKHEVDQFTKYEKSSSELRSVIPDDVKIFVWRRDEGRCVKCGGNENLEYDHIIPVSKGGSNTERNLQILCELCNREKGASI